MAILAGKCMKEPPYVKNDGRKDQEGLRGSSHPLHIGIKENAVRTGMIMRMLPGTEG